MFNKIPKIRFIRYVIMIIITAINPNLQKVISAQYKNVRIYSNAVGPTNARGTFPELFTFISIVIHKLSEICKMGPVMTNSIWCLGSIARSSGSIELAQCIKSFVMRMR